jgi:hypothetical protein
VRKGISLWASTGSIPFNTNTENRYWIRQSPNGGTIPVSVMASAINASSPPTVNIATIPPPGETTPTVWSQFQLWKQSVSQHMHKLYCNGVKIANTLAFVSEVGTAIATGVITENWWVAGEMATAAWYHWEVNPTGYTGEQQSSGQAAPPTPPSGGTPVLSLDPIVAALNQIATMEIQSSFNHGGAVVSVQSGVIA